MSQDQKTPPTQNPPEDNSVGGISVDDAGIPLSEMTQVYIPDDEKEPVDGE